MRLTSLAIALVTSTLTVYADSSIPTLEVPDLIGMTLDQATDALKQRGFTNAPSMDPYATTCTDRKVPDKTINCQDPHGRARANEIIHVQLFHESAFKITEEMTRKLVGMTVDQAKDQLARWGHEGRITIEKNDLKGNCDTGKVCRVTPEKLTLKGDITLYIGQALTITLPP